MAKQTKPKSKTDECKVKPGIRRKILVDANLRMSIAISVKKSDQTVRLWAKNGDLRLECDTILNVISNQLGLKRSELLNK